MTVSEEDHFAITLEPGEVQAGVFRVQLTDTEKLLLPGHGRPAPLHSKTPTSFTLKIKPDRQPQVQTTISGVSTIVVPKARIPMECHVQDDFAVSSVRLHHAWRADQSGTLETTGSEPLASLRDALHRNSIRFQHVLDLHPLGMPVGSTFRFWIEADDNDDVSGPNTGKSSYFLLRIVSEEELRGELLRREKEQRQHMEAYWEHQQTLLTECQAMQAAVRAVPELDSPTRQLLVKIRRRQKLLATRLAETAGRLEGILAEIQNNRLEGEGGPLQHRLRALIIEPVRQLASVAMPGAAGHLDQAWRHAANQLRRDLAFSETIELQQEIVANMHEILQSMIKTEDFQEAVNLLLGVQKAQQDVLDMTEQEKQDRIRRLIPELDQ